MLKVRLAKQTWSCVYMHDADYMNDYCSDGQKPLPVHMPLNSEQAGVVLFSHRRNTTPRSSVCQLPFQVDTHASFTMSFRFFDTVSDSFICFMYLEVSTIPNEIKHPL